MIARKQWQPAKLHAQLEFFCAVDQGMAGTVVNFLEASCCFLEQEGDFVAAVTFAVTNRPYNFPINNSFTTGSQPWATRSTTVFRPNPPSAPPAFRHWR
jgi:hypothetical protein